MKSLDYLTILPLDDAFAIVNRRRSSGYLDVAAGLLPRPVRVGPNRVGIPAGEMRQIAVARIAGADDQAIRDLVARIHQERKSLAEAA